jgi:hypothetical protein
VAWSWWSDSGSPRDLERQRHFVDFAAAQGFEYALVDEGWSAEWVPELVAYAAQRGVRVILWSHWRDLRTPAQRAAAFDRWAAWGVAGVKVDFLHSDSGRRLAVMDDIARDAGARRLVVDFHGCTVPRGLQRTWPNVMTLEAVWGAEHTKSGIPSDPAHNVNLVFIRNAIGSMDYTPVTFSARDRRTTAGQELAEAVLYESGLQHFADSPESYLAWPAAAAVLRDVPAAWDDTRLVEGAPDRYATIARRSGERWFVASIAAGAARTATVPLRFLAPGRAYRARITGDDGAGGLSVQERTVTAGDTLTVPVAEGGGFVVALGG